MVAITAIRPPPEHTGFIPQAKNPGNFPLYISSKRTSQDESEFRKLEEFDTNSRYFPPLCRKYNLFLSRIRNLPYGLLLFYLIRYPNEEKEA